jgi:hypothetical protein
MLHYFYVIDGSWMRDTLSPALAESWRARSFGPCRAMCSELARQDAVPTDALVHRVRAALHFDRVLWRALVGECLLFGADAMPQIPCLVRSLLCQLAPERLDAEPTERAAFTPIEQVYYGARDLRLGAAWHRPGHVGWNDTPDIERLAGYLKAVDPSLSTPAALAPLLELSDEADRVEELEYVRNWWPALVEMYDAARAEHQVIVCERVDR